MVYLVANREPTLAGFSYKLLSDIASLGCALILPIQAASQEFCDREPVWLAGQGQQ